jgi:hypothetical protein
MDLIGIGKKFALRGKVEATSLKVGSAVTCIV